MPATRPPKLLSTTLDISKRGKFQRAALALDTEERKLHLICALPPLPSRLDLNPLNVRTHLFRLTASGGESNSAKYGAKKGQATGRSLSAGKKKKKRKEIGAHLEIHSLQGYTRVHPKLRSRLCAVILGRAKEDRVYVRPGLFYRPCIFPVPRLDGAHTATLTAAALGSPITLG